MENHARNNNENEGHFYKGLFFGVLIGVGLIWFLNSETGRRFVKTARKRMDEALSTEPGLEDYEEEAEVTNSEPESSTFNTPPPHRFFRKSR